MLIRYASDVAIEVTRRCNMKCAHCLRGDAQNIPFHSNWQTSKGK